MADYKSMYYHLAGRMAVAVDTMTFAVEALEATSSSLVGLTEKLKNAQRATEEMFLSADDDESSEEE